MQTHLGELRALVSIPFAQADMTTGEAEVAVLTGKLADANSTAEDALITAAQATAKVQLLTAACDDLHNNVSTAHRGAGARSLLCMPVVTMLPIVAHVHSEECNMLRSLYWSLVPDRQRAGTSHARDQMKC